MARKRVELWLFALSAVLTVRISFSREDFVLVRVIVIEQPLDQVR